MQQAQLMTPKLQVSKIKNWNQMDIEDICDATIDTMKETMGFNIGTHDSTHAQRSSIISYWEGVVLVPERVLFVGRLDGTISGALQLLKPAPSNQTSSFSCSIDNLFVASWARGMGLSNLLLEAAEKEAKDLGFSLIKLSVRENRQSAIELFERRGYKKWGVLPKYEVNQGNIVAGFFYYKEI
jgi:ribosomal protein S18 acetylase RimI-like enzyme